MKSSDARAQILHRGITSRCSAHGAFALGTKDASTVVRVDSGTDRWHLAATVHYECGCDATLRGNAALLVAI
jgi:hypothetical protein